MSYLTITHSRNGRDIALTVPETLLFGKLRTDNAISDDDRSTMQSALERLGRLSLATTTEREARQ